MLKIFVYLNLCNAPGYTTDLDITHACTVIVPGLDSLLLAFLIHTKISLWMAIIKLTELTICMVAPQLTKWHDIA